MDTKQITFPHLGYIVTLSYDGSLFLLYAQTHGSEPTDDNLMVFHDRTLTGVLHQLSEAYFDGK